jgi:hypothetical protein
MNEQEPTSTGLDSSECEERIDIALYFPAENPSRERIRQELLREDPAMPLRSLVAQDPISATASLECGHQKRILIRLRKKDRIRCRDCYEEGLRKAQELIERDCG